MEKPFNLKVIETKENMLKVIQEAQLPATVTQLLLREITSAVDVQVHEILEKEKEEYKKTKQNDQ